MRPFGQVLTAMITPFTDDGAVDHGAVARLVDHLLSNGSDGIVVAGTTGESPTLGDDEKLALYAAVAEAAGDRGAVIANTGTYDTAHSVEMSKRAADVGVDGHMAVTPYYSRPPQEGLIRHFTAIADAVDIPLMLYNIPGRTGTLIEIPTLTELCEHPNVAAIKDAVENVAFTARTREAIGDAAAIYSGADAFTLPMMTAGAVGVVSVASHLVGPQIKRMVESAEAGDLGTAAKMHQALLPFFDALFLETNPIPLKGILNRAWGPVGTPRLPLIPASDATIDTLEQALGRAQQA